MRKTLLPWRATGRLKAEQMKLTEARILTLRTEKPQEDIFGEHSSGLLGRVRGQPGGSPPPRRSAPYSKPTAVA